VASRKCWRLGAREHLRGLWFDLVRGLGRCLEGLGNWHEAGAHYCAALAIYPEVKEAHRGRLRCLRGEGAIAAAEGAYAYCRDQLLATTGRPPSAETEKLYRQITA